MATCPGRIVEGNYSCTSQLVRCKKCGAVGCRNKKCSNFQFDISEKCLSCGARYQTEDVF